MSSFKNLSVWQESILLAEEVYILTDSFPKKEQFGLVDQLRRSAVSIASNIAEGHGRFSKADTMRFLYIARGSLNELETQMIIAHRIGYLRMVDIEKVNVLLGKCGRLLNGLINYYRSLHQANHTTPKN